MFAAADDDVALAGTDFFAGVTQEADCSRTQEHGRSRTRFSSVEPVRGVVCWQRTEIEYKAADLELGVVGDKDRSVDRLTVDRGAICRSEVFDGDALVGAGEAGVAAGNGQIADPEITGGCGAERVDADSEAKVIGVAIRRAAQTPGALQGSDPPAHPVDPVSFAVRSGRKQLLALALARSENRIDWSAILYLNRFDWRFSVFGI